MQVAPQTIAQPRPQSSVGSVKAAQPAKPAALVDLFSLDTPAPVAPTAQPIPCAAEPLKSSLENEVSACERSSLKKLVRNTTVIAK